MNRSDSIQAAARTIAEQINPEPEARNLLADQMIELVALTVAAVGKSVAIKGETYMNEGHENEDAEDKATGYTMYMTGEQIQDGARWVQEEAKGADLERYERDGLEPVWVPAVGRQLSGRWAVMDPDARCSECDRTLAFGHMLNCSRSVTAGEWGPNPHCESDAHADNCPMDCACDPAPVTPMTAWAAAQAGVGAVTEACQWIPGEAAPACDFDAECPVHSNVLPMNGGAQPPLF